MDWCVSMREILIYRVWSLNRGESYCVRDLKEEIDVLEQFLEISVNEATYGAWRWHRSFFFFGFYFWFLIFSAIFSFWFTFKMILLGQGRNTLYDVDMVLANIMLGLNDVFKTDEFGCYIGRGLLVARTVFLDNVMKIWLRIWWRKLKMWYFDVTG